MKRIINLLFKALSRYGGNKSENLRNEVKKKRQAWAGERCCTMRIHTYNQEAPVYAKAIPTYSQGLRVVLFYLYL